MSDALDLLRKIHGRLSILIRIEEHGISAPATTAFICSRILIEMESAIKKVTPQRISKDTQEAYYELDKLLNLYNGEQE